jgi:hypothetical protein
VGSLSRKRYTQYVEQNGKELLAGARWDWKVTYNGGVLCAMALKSANGRQNTTQKPGFLCAVSRR